MAKIHDLLYNRSMKKIDDIRKFIWIEFAIWFIILCFAATGVRMYRHHKAKEMVTYQLFMPDVDGIIVGSPVKFMGVQVGYIDKVKIVTNNIYIKIVMTDKNVTLPKGSIATVEFNGMGGSKSLEIYPPTEESLAMNKLIVMRQPIRLNDSLTLLGDMFNKIDSIMMRMSVFAKEAGVLENGVETKDIQNNVNMLDRWIKDFGGNNE